MESLGSQPLFWLLAVPVLASFVSAVCTLHFMRVKANRRLPDDRKISYFLPMTRWNRVTDEYKRLYPNGRAYPLWQVSVIGTAVFAVGSVLLEVWKLALAK